MSETKYRYHCDGCESGDCTGPREFDALESALTQARAELEEAKRWRATHEVCHDKWDGLQAKLAAADVEVEIAREVHAFDVEQAAELRKALSVIVQAKNDTAMQLRERALKAYDAIPASVQARAELWKAMEIVCVEADKHDCDWPERDKLSDALARLAALDSAQKRDHQFDYETGECTHGLIGNYSTCNGDPRGCCRRWGPEFQHCCYHLKKEWDSAQKGERHG